MSFEMSTEDFFLQLGPDFEKYTSVFVANGFNDVDTICTMNIEDDISTMFKNEDLPLGHRRKMEAAIRNLVACKTSQTENPKSMTEGTNMEGFPDTQVNKGAIEKLEDQQRQKLAELQSKLDAETASKKELDHYVPPPDPEGPYKSQTCSICHVRGHRSSGNKDGSQCTKNPCNSWKLCGRRDKHKSDITREKKNSEKETRSLYPK